MFLQNYLRYRFKIDYGLLIVAFLGFSFAYFRYGFGVLDPTSVEWLLGRGGDKAQHFLGWHFFRHEEWHFPLGLIKGYYAPIGTSIGITDSIPLMALTLKSFSGLLPPDFQYHGFWIYLSTVLQAVFGYLLIGLFTRITIIKIISSLLFLLSPIMLFRVGGHIQLVSHWFILAALWGYFSTGEGFYSYKYSIFWLFLVSIVCLVNPYIATMVMGLAYASVGKEWLITRNLKAKQALILSLAFLLVLVMEWWLIGYFNYRDYAETSFGYFSMNLNALINSFGHSRFIPRLPVYTDGQYEGFNYLGLGMLFLIFIGLTLAIIKREKLGVVFPFIYRNIFLVLACIFYFVFALSNKISLGDNLISHINLKDELPRIISVFRSSGRFFWPVYYLISLGFIVLLIRNVSQKYAIGILSIALFLQIVDFKPLRTNHRNEKYQQHLTDDRWNELFNKFDKVITIPLLVRSLKTHDDYIDFVYPIASRGKWITMGHVARKPLQTEINHHREKYYKILCSGELAFDTLYVFNNDTFSDSNSCLGDKASCLELDEYIVCYNKEVDLQLSNETVLHDLKKVRS